MSPNLKAFLDMLAWSEIGPALLALSDNGYNVCVGSTPQHHILFPSYAVHPRIHNVAQDSDAAGRYQFMGRFWAPYSIQLKLPDFGHESQDRWCVQLIKECHALDDIELGHFDTAVVKCKSRWASLPGAGYGQHENAMAACRQAFINAGGSIS